MEIFSSLKTRVLTLSLVFSLLQVSSCALQPAHDSSTLPALTGHLPHEVQKGKSSVIKLQIKNWQKGTRVALTPSGPYVKQQMELDQPPVAMTSDGKNAYVVSLSGNKKNKTSNLKIITFHTSEKPQQIGFIPSIDGQVRSVSYFKQQLLLAMEGGGIKLVDVTNPEKPELTDHFDTTSPVIDIHTVNNSIYLLLDNNVLLKLGAADKSADNQFHKLQQWKLPFTTHAFEIRNHYLWLVGPRGIAVASLSGSPISLLDQKPTSGHPTGIQLKDKLALVTDGPGGLVVFDISTPGHLRWTGSYNKRGAINRIAIANNTAVAILDNETALAIDVSRPDLPISGAAFHPGEPILASALLKSSTDSRQPPNILLATTRSLQRVVMEKETNYAITPEGINLGGSRRGVIRHNILYVADWFSGLHLYDISIPQQLRHIGNYHTPGSSKGVALMGNYALVGDDDQGLQIIDIQHPQHPTFVANLPPSAMARTGLAYTMTRVGKTLYLADHRGGFHIIDLSDIHHPRRIGGFNTPGKSWGIAVTDKYVLVADDTTGLLVFDASHPAHPKLVAQFDPHGQAEDVKIKNGLAYVAFFDKGLYVLDIHNPARPTILGHLDVPGNARGIELADGLAYVTGWESGLHIVDIHNPKHLHILGSFDTDGDAWGVNVKDGYAYVLDWWGGIKVIDVHNPSHPTYVSQYQGRGTLKELRTKNHYLYAASGAGGLQVYDIKNVLGPIWARGLDFDGEAQDIWHDDDRAYVAAGDGGVLMFDTLDPFYTHRIGQLATPGEARLVRAWNDYLYIQDSRAGLMVADVRDPRKPRILGRHPLHAQDLWVDDQALWAATKQGLTWWPHQVSGRLINKQQIAIAGGVNYVRTRDDMLVTANQDGDIRLWRKTKDQLLPLSVYHAGEPISDLELNGQTLYLLGEKTGLMAVDTSHPTTPHLAMVYPATGYYTRFIISNQAAFFAGENKLASATLLPNIKVSMPQPGQVDMAIPADMPTGQYHLLLMTPTGERQWLPDAVSVRYSPSHSPHSVLEKYREMLKSR